jgi:hypothetical protein
MTYRERMGDKDMMEDLSNWMTFLARFNEGGKPLDRKLI